MAGVCEAEAVAALKGLTTSTLRQAVVTLREAGAKSDCRVSGNKQELAERVLAAMKDKHPRGWGKKVALLTKGKGAASGEKTPTGVAKKRQPKPTSRRPRARAAFSSEAWAQYSRSVSSGIENGWPLYVEERRLNRAAGGHHMYLVGRSSHSTFQIIGSSENAYQVNLLIEGGGPSCSCLDHRTRKTVCKHILFTLIRVLGIQKQDLQHGLRKETVQAAIESTSTFLVDAVPGWFSPPTWLKAAKDRAVPEAQVEQRPLEKDSMCAICLCDFAGLSMGSAELVFCRHFCGNSLHRDCFEQQRKYDIRRGADVLCAYCRQPWGS